MTTVTSSYLDGITDARQFMRDYPHISPALEIETLTTTIRLYAAQSPVGQYLRGQRDFWRNQLKKGA